MKMPRPFTLGLIALAAMALMPASTGSINGCSVTTPRDANLQHLDRAQSSGAAKICAFYLNTMESGSSR
jgi:hypothetical protein